MEKTDRKGRRTTGNTSSNNDKGNTPAPRKDIRPGETKGKVYLVGAGPGDPSLITRKAIECIGNADLIVYDNLVHPRLLLYANKESEKIYVGKLAGKHTMPQDEINDLLAKSAEEGKIVCRLKGGDPFVFGRGGEEALFLSERNIAFEVVPGVSSAIAAPGYAGIPLTHREVASTVAFVTGHESPEKPVSTIAWDKISTGVDTLVFLMGVGNLPKIAARLMKEGRDPQTPAAVIEWGTLPRQRCVRGCLHDIAEVAEKARIRPPSIIIVGKVVGLRDHLAWFETKPLFGRTILVTRATSQASRTVKMIEDLGGEAVEFPTIDIQPSEDPGEIDAAIEAASEYDWIVFTSVNGVEAFFSRLLELRKDARCLSPVRVGSIGPGTTKALLEYHVIPDLQPERFSSEGIVEELQREGDLDGQRILLARSELADETLPSALAKLGASVRAAVCYRTVIAKPDDGVIRRLLAGGIDAVTFTSASTARNFAAILGEDLKKLPAATVVASIGPVTTAAATKAGLTVDIEAKEYTIPQLINELIAHFHSHPADDSLG